jgi:hypothetical protein
VAISKMAFLYIFKNGKHLCKTLATRAPIFKKKMLKIFYQKINKKDKN